MSAFTAGPWRVVPDTLGNVESESGIQVAQAQQVKPRLEDIYSVERMANARLIAAAPELLEALELFMNIWNSGMASSSSKKAQKYRADMWDKANDAIAKAKGEHAK